MAKREFYGQFGQQGQYGFGQTGQFGQQGQYGFGQTGQFGQQGQYGFGQTGQFGQQGQYGFGQTGQFGQAGQFGQFGQQGQIGENNPQITGDLPLLRMISTEHVQALTTLRMLQDANPEVQRRIFPTVGQALLVHLQAEEEELHSLVQGIPRAQEAHAVVESLHVQSERLINNLLSMQYGTRAWNQNMDELISLLEQKIAVEEQVFFPVIRSRFNVPQLQRAEGRYIARKLRLLEAQTY